MTTFDVLRLVAGREIRERIRSKVFRVSTGFTLVLILAAAILPGLLRDDGPAKYQIGVAGAGASELAARLPVVAGSSFEKVTVEVRRLEGVAEADRLVAAGDLDAAVVDGQIIVDTDLGDRIGSLVQEAHRQVVGEAALAGAGVGEDVAGRVLQPQPLPVRALDPLSAEESDRRGLVFFGTMLLYVQLLAFGSWVAGGVVEEKSSRVVELLLGKARPSQLLAGKVIGIGVLGFVQLVGFVVVGLVAAGQSGSVELPPRPSRSPPRWSAGSSSATPSTAACSP